jgi:hypothetical protein
MIWLAASTNGRLLTVTRHLYLLYLQLKTTAPLCLTCRQSFTSMPRAYVVYYTQYECRSAGLCLLYRIFYRSLPCTSKPARRQTLWHSPTVIILLVMRDNYLDLPAHSKRIVEINVASALRGQLIDRHTLHVCRHPLWYGVRYGRRRVVFNSYRSVRLELTVVDCIFWYKGGNNEVVRRRGNYIVVS